MIAKCLCDQCGESIEFATEEFLSGSCISCPHCGGETILSVAPKSKQPTSQASPASPNNPPQKTAIAIANTQTQKRVQNYLAFIRANSSYKVLRLIVEVAFLLLLVVGFIAAALFIIGFFQDEYLNRYRSAGQLFEGLGIAVLAGVLIFAARQSALLLIDIADTLLMENSKEHSKKE